MKFFGAIISLFLWVSVSVAQSPTPLYNNNRLIIGYLASVSSGDKTIVKDACFRQVGWVVYAGTNAGTFTPTNIRLSPSALPTLLLQQSAACDLTKMRLP